MTQRLLRLSEVINRVGISRSSIYLKIKNCQFPEMVKVGGHSVRWVESEINDYIASIIESSKGTK